MVTNIFYTAWTESASESVDDDDRGSYYQNVMDKSVRFYSSASLGIIAILPILFKFLVNKDFQTAYNLIPILIIGAFFHSVADLYCSLYTAFKMTKKIAKTTIYSAIINISINMFFVSKFGLYAAAFSTALAYIIIAVYMHIELSKVVEISYKLGYIITEVFAYIIILTIYYIGKRWIQFFIIPILVFYCYKQNEELLYKTIVSLIGKNRKSKIISTKEI